MRALFIEKMYEWSKKPYQKYFKKNEPWNVTPQQLMLYPQDSLGFHLACFLMKYNFEMQPKLEEHDVIHVLTDTGVLVIDEIGMQYFLLGNGKKSLYLMMVLVTGTFFYPNRLKTFYKFYKRGQNAYEFHNLNFQKMLYQPIKEIQFTFNIK